MMVFYEANSFSRLTGGVGGDGGGTGGWNAPRQLFDDSGHYHTRPLPERVRTIYHKVVRTSRIV
jgi:hypothetical protein